jgi:hypothetical protein
MLKLNFEEKNGEKIPTGLHFENQGGDFQNDYRFMAAVIINKKIKSPNFKVDKFEVDIEPSVQSILRFGYQASANSEESVFNARVEDGNLIFSFGDHSTHAGQFMFEPGVGGGLKQTWNYPVQQTLKILNLMGDKRIMFSDKGAMKIDVDSGQVSYSYILPAHTK